MAELTRAGDRRADELNPVTQFLRRLTWLPFPWRAGILISLGWHPGRRGYDDSAQMAMKSRAIVIARRLGEADGAGEQPRFRILGFDAGAADEEPPPHPSFAWLGLKPRWGESILFAEIPAVSHAAFIAWLDTGLELDQLPESVLGFQHRLQLLIDGPDDHIPAALVERLARSADDFAALVRTLEAREAGGEIDAGADGSAPPGVWELRLRVITRIRGSAVPQDVRATVLDRLAERWKPDLVRWLVANPGMESPVPIDQVNVPRYVSQLDASQLLALGSELIDATIPLGTTWNGRTAATRAFEVIAALAEEPVFRTAAPGDLWTADQVARAEGRERASGPLLTGMMVRIRDRSGRGVVVGASMVMGLRALRDISLAEECHIAIVLGEMSEAALSADDAYLVAGSLRAWLVRDRGDKWAQALLGEHTSVDDAGRMDHWPLVRFGRTLSSDEAQELGVALAAACITSRIHEPFGGRGPAPGRLAEVLRNILPSLGGPFRSVGEALDVELARLYSERATALSGALAEVLGQATPPGSLATVAQSMPPRELAELVSPGQFPDERPEALTRFLTFALTELVTMNACVVGAARDEIIGLVVPGVLDLVAEWLIHGGASFEVTDMLGKSIGPDRCGEIGQRAAVRTIEASAATLADALADLDDGLAAVADAATRFERLDRAPFQVRRLPSPQAPVRAAVRALIEGAQAGLDRARSVWQPSVGDIPLPKSMAALTELDRTDPQGPAIQ